MKVLLYSEHLDRISKSGLGKAIKHQILALENEGIDYTLDSDDDFDILHINTYFLKSMLFASKCRDRGIPVVYHAHSTREDFENSFIFSNQIAPIFKQWLITCYRIGDVLITPTPYSKRLLDGYGINRPIFSLSNGICLEKFAPIQNARAKFLEMSRLSGDDFVVIGIGLYLERKGLLEFVELARRIPEAKFIWYGYTDLKLVPAKIREAVLNPPGNLTFAGYVDNSIISLALQGCDLFLFTTFEETEGIPAVEACASRADFVVRDIPVFEDWLEDGKNVYKAKDVNGFEAHIRGFMAGERPSLTEAAYEVAEKRNISAIGKRLRSIYEAAIEAAAKRIHD